MDYDREKVYEVSIVTRDFNKKDVLLMPAPVYNIDGERIGLIKSDNGRGINVENINKLGKAFFTTKETGTGLGLSVCFRIINEHGGHINVKSCKGKGTTFTISLPCIEDFNN